MEDDLYKLIDNIIKNDALILIAPTYVLTIPGKFKIVIDRFFLYIRNYKGINKILNFKEKPYESIISDRCPVDYNNNF
uniref:NADPH-dependent FMN reductase-like domain-containing protein n=1 Tax=candidate division WOR-3 bacterium TaxID=2052148 RepID=A0A7V4E3I7_UNCW3